MKVRTVPMDALLGSARLVLLEVRPLYRYEGETQTGTVIGTRYIVANTSTYERFTVKVMTTVPKISSDYLAQNGGKVYVRFTRGIGKPYVSGRNVEWSFEAEDISLIQNRAGVE